MGVVDRMGVEENSGSGEAAPPRPPPLDWDVHLRDGRKVLLFERQFFNRSVRARKYDDACTHKQAPRRPLGSW